MVKYDN